MSVWQNSLVACWMWFWLCQNWVCEHGIIRWCVLFLCVWGGRSAVEVFPKEISTHRLQWFRLSRLFLYTYPSPQVRQITVCDSQVEWYHTLLPLHEGASLSKEQCAFVNMNQNKGNLLLCAFRWCLLVPKLNLNAPERHTDYSCSKALSPMMSFVRFLWFIYFYDFYVFYYTQWYTYFIYKGSCQHKGGRKPSSGRGKHVITCRLLQDHPGNEAGMSWIWTHRIKNSKKKIFI